MAELAAVAGFLDASEGQAGIGAHKVVDEAAAGLELVASDLFAVFDVTSEDRGAKAERAVVGDPDRLLLVGYRDDRCYRAEKV